MGPPAQPPYCDSATAAGSTRAPFPFVFLSLFVIPFPFVEIRQIFFFKKKEFVRSGSFLGEPVVVYLVMFYSALEKLC
jgi:hypothetical protein